MCPGGQRDCVQVFSNGAPSVVSAVVYLAAAGSEQQPVDFSQSPIASLAALACLVALSGCCGDTWSSEVGPVAASSAPRLITTFRQVPAGTNGGVSLPGTLASCVGGFIVGLVYFVTWTGLAYGTMYTPQWPLILVGAIAGLLCSLIDSILGATVQYSGYDREKRRVVNNPGKDVEHISGRPWLDNHAVNLVSSSVTAVVLPWMLWQSGLFR